MAKTIFNYLKLNILSKSQIEKLLAGLELEGKSVLLLNCESEELLQEMEKRGAKVTWKEITFKSKNGFEVYENLFLQIQRLQRHDFVIGSFVNQMEDFCDFMEKVESFLKDTTYELRVFVKSDYLYVGTEYAKAIHKWTYNSGANVDFNNALTNYSELLALVSLSRKGKEDEYNALPLFEKLKLKYEKETRLLQGKGVNHVKKTVLCPTILGDGKSLFAITGFSEDIWYVLVDSRFAELCEKNAIEPLQGDEWTEFYEYLEETVMGVLETDYGKVEGENGQINDFPAFEWEGGDYWIEIKDVSTFENGNIN